METGTVEHRSVVETASPGSITLLFAATLFMLVFGFVGTFVIDTNVLSTLAAGIVLLVAFVITVIFRQVVLEVRPDEVALFYGTERVWISRSDIAEVEPFDMTFGRRFLAFISLGPWSAIGRQKVRYFGSKAPMVLISTTQGKRFAVSVEDPAAVLSVTSP